MWRVLIRKGAEVFFFLLFLTFTSFVLVRLAPGDPVLTILNVDELSVTNEQVEQMREELGFNQPLLIQYGIWLKQTLLLDFGESYGTGQPVLEMIQLGLPATLELSVGAIVVMLALSLPIGSLSALYRDTWFDHVSRILSGLGASIPSFWLGLILIDLLGVRLNWFPTMGRDGFHSVVMPSLTLGLAMSSVYVRLLRSSLLDSLSQEFIRAARARGLSEMRIFFVHAFRYSLPPVVTVFGVSLGSLLGGVVVIEVLFAYPGLGKLAVEAIHQRDYPLIQAYLVVMGILVFLVNTCVEVAYRFLHPELRLKERMAKHG